MGDDKSSAVKAGWALREERVMKIQWTTFRIEGSMLHYVLDWLAAEFSAYLRKMAL